MVALVTGPLVADTSQRMYVDIVNLTKELRRLEVLDRGLAFGSLFGLIAEDVVSTNFVSSLFTCVLKTLEGSEIGHVRWYCAAKADVVADYMTRRGHDCNHCHGCKFTKDLGISLARFEHQRLIYYSYRGLAPVIVMSAPLLTATLQIAQDYVRACNGA